MYWQKWRTIANNAQYWQNHHERGLLKAEYLCNYQLRLWFEEELDVSIYDLDFYPLLIEEDPGEVLRSLRDVSYFKTAQGHYSLNWFDPHCFEQQGEPIIDLAPECVRYFCQIYGIPRKLTSNSTSSSYSHPTLKLPLENLPKALLYGGSMIGIFPVEKE